MMLALALLTILFLNEAGEPIGAAGDVRCLRWDSATPDRWVAVVQGPAIFADGFESGDTGAWGRAGLCG